MSHRQVEGCFVNNTVLVIDDDTATVESIELMLKEHGYRVLTAGDGPTGLWE